MAYDENGNWIDDQSTFGYEDPSLYENPFMQTQMPGQNYSNSKWNFGAPQAVGQNVYNQFLTGTKNLGQLQTNPSLLYNAMVATGQPTMDLNALMGLDSSGMPYQGSGGGGGGGGGNGYNPNFVTSNLDNLANSPPGSPGNLIYSGIKAKKSPIDIKLDLRGGGQYDTDTLKALDQQVDDAFGEFSAAQRNQMAGANQPAQQTPVQEWLAKNGLINPAEQYTADNLPADMDVGWAGMEGGKAAQGAIDAAVGTGANIKRLNDERRGLQDKATVANGIRDVKQLGLQAATNRYLSQDRPPAVDDDLEQARLAMGQQADVNAQQFNPNATPTPQAAPGRKPLAPMGAISYDAKTKKPIYADIPGPNGQHNIYDPTQGRPRQDTGEVGGWSGGWMRPARDAAARQLNPGGDVARMAMLKRAAAAQERRKADLVASARSAPAYDQAVRQLAAQQVQNSGRTPARDAQRVLLNYMRSGGMQG